MTAIAHRRCVFPGCGDLFDEPPEPLAHEGHLFCPNHRIAGQSLLKRGWGLLHIVHWPRCRWCNVLLPGKRFEAYLDEGWEPGGYVYCDAHAVIEGRDPEIIALRGLDEANALEALPDRKLIEFPQRVLHRLAGPMVPGRVTYVGAFSGGGKTSAVTNWIWHWVQEAGHRVHYLPTEGSIGEVLTRFACFLAKADADEALSFRYRDAERAGDPRAKAMRDEIRLAIEFLRKDRDFLSRLRIDPMETLTPRSFTTAIEATRVMESDLLIVDHTDHLESDADDQHPDIVISNRVQMMALRAAKQLNIPVLLMTQLNSRYAGAGQDPLVKFRPPSPDWLYNKGKKEMIGAQIIGLHRVLDPRADPNALRKVRARELDPWRVALPNVMGASDMKFRFGRGTQRGTVLMSYTDSRLTDMPQDIFDVVEDQRSRGTAADNPDWTHN